jgi:hypothetical protein
MKCSKAAVHRKTHRIPEIRFEDQKLTSFAGLVVYQALFSRIGLITTAQPLFSSPEGQLHLRSRCRGVVAGRASAAGLSAVAGHALLRG